MMTQPILAETLDARALATAFDGHGRVQIGGFLTQSSAQDLLRDLAASREWKLTFNRGDQVVDYGPAAYAALDAREKGAIARDIIAGARTGFQFCYDTIRETPDMAQDAPVRRLVRFLNSEPVLSLLRAITGFDGIARVDGHASRYGPGQFLTTHDDAKPNETRLAAYVMNLSPQWRPEWGGLLEFYDRQGNVTRGFTPSFNTLNLFAVPQPHSVTWVTPIAPHPRIAITGWLMAD